MLGYGVLIGQVEGTPSASLLTAIPEPAAATIGVVVPLALVRWRRVARAEISKA
jgi:hypothetical protein